METKVYVQEFSISSMDGTIYEPSDGGGQEDALYGGFNELSLMSCLSQKQRKVASLLKDGYTRKEIAEQLEISVQSIHQIIPRMRKRISNYVNIT